MIPEGLGFCQEGNQPDNAVPSSGCAGRVEAPPCSYLGTYGESQVVRVMGVMKGVPGMYLVL